MMAGALAVLEAQQAPAPAARLLFTNINKASGIAFTHTSGASPDKYLVETMGSGAVLLDYDDDGRQDLFVVDGGSIADPAVAARARHRLFHNEPDGTFRDVSASSGIAHGEYGMGACAGDVDNDGRVDIYVTSYGPNALYRNDGKGRFTDVTRAAGVGDPRWGTSCAFLDLDRDGDLDLFVTNYLDAPPTNNKFCGDPRRRIRVYCHPLNYPSVPNLLYRNDGKGAFTDISREAGLSRHVGNGLGIAVGDYDDDGWPDVFVANDGVPNFLFHNERNGTFAEVGLVSGVAVARDGKPRAGMGTEFADYTGDGRLDLIVTNHEFETHSLFRNDAGSFVDATVEAGLSAPTLPFVGFGTVFVDVDNDADLDLSTVNGHVIDNTAVFRPGSTWAQRKLLFTNAGGRRFTEVSRQAGAGFAADSVGRTLVAGDLDNDGDQDLVVTNNGGALEVLRNDSTPRRNALLVRALLASGRDAIGARVTITAGGRAQMREIKSGSSYLGQSELRAHFGLGAATQVERLDIRWPGGQTETVRGTMVNRLVTISQGRGITGQAGLSGR
jgi:hypothetical protein